MLCVNVFLCSAMTCSFSRSEVELVDEKAGSVYTVQVGRVVMMVVDAVDAVGTFINDFYNFFSSGL